MAGLRIGLLGGLRLEIDDRALASMPQAARSLFSYLAIYPGRRVTRDWIAGTFWPDLTETAARKRLSQALWQIQTTCQQGGVPGGILAVTNADVSFHPPTGTWIDVAAFEDALSEAYAALPRTTEHVEFLEQALAIYQGDLLIGIYDEWIEVERQRLRQRYLNALLDVISDLRARADHSAALGYARQWAALDVLNESAHAEVIRLCALVGRYNEALQQYDACAQLLEEELGVEPSAELVSLRSEVMELRSGGASPLIPTPGATHRPVQLIGREEERAGLVRALEQALAGEESVVFVEGESGIGKTRLLQQAISDARWRGFAVVDVACREEEADQPFATLVRALESGITGLQWRRLADEMGSSTMTDVARVLSPAARRMVGIAQPAPLDPSERHERIASALEAVLVAVKRAGLMLLLIDDAQWIDGSSMEIIANSETELERTAVLILGFRAVEMRDRVEVWDAIRAIDTRGRTTRIELGGLSVEDTARLVRDGLSIDDVSRRVVERLHDETAGNPLFILELVRAAGDDLSDLDSAGLLVTGDVVDVIRTRLDGLDTTEREVANAVAVLARPVADDEIEKITGLGGRSRLEALGHLTAAGILVEHEGDIAFTHEQVRKVAVGLIPKERSRQLYRTAAVSIESNHPDRVEELARLFAAAEDPDRAAHYAIEAARRAVGLGSFAAAVARFDEADRWADRGAEIDDRFAVLGEWEEALDVLGRRADQEAILHRMDELTVKASLALEVQRRRALLLANEGHFRDAVASAEAALGVSEPDHVFLHTFGRVLSQAGRNEEAIAWLERAVHATEDGSSAAARIATDLGGTLAEVQRYDEAQRWLDKAKEMYGVIDDRRGVAEVEGNLAIVFMEIGQPDLAVEAYRRALTLCREIGYKRGAAVNLNNLGNALYFQGHIGEALAGYSEAVAAFGAIGDRSSAALVGANAASVRMRMLGDLSVASEVRSYLGFLEQEEHGWGAAFCHEILGAIALRAGETPEATIHVTVGLDLLSDQQHRWLEAHLEKLAAEVGLVEGNFHEAEEHIERAAALCAELGLNDVAPSVGAVASRIASSSGEPAHALELARIATDLLAAGAEGPHLVWFARYLAAAAMDETSEALSALGRAIGILLEMLDDVSADDRALSLRSVPEHVAIRESMARHERVAITVRLPGRDVPTGRAIEEGEWVDVTLTVSDPDDLALQGVERRRAVLLRVLDEADRQGAALRIGDVATALEVSEMTVRRDLNALRNAGHDVTTRGSRA